jgi:hypothetical protein
MKSYIFSILACAALITAPIAAQDMEDAGGGDDAGGMGEIIVTGSMRRSGGIAIPVEKPPVIGLRRQADSAVRNIEIISDSREEDLRKREVQAMLFAAIDRAKRDGFSLVTGQLEIVEVTRANWQNQFPELALKSSETDEDDDYDDED